MTSTNHTRPESNNHTPWTPDSASLAWMSTPPPSSDTGPESDERQETAPTEIRPVPEPSPVAAARGEASFREETPDPARVSAPSATAPPRPAPMAPPVLPPMELPTTEPSTPPNAPPMPASVVPPAMATPLSKLKDNNKKLRSTSSSREPHKDDEANLRLSEVAGNGNPTSNTSCTQFSK